jgi:amino acid transporter
MKDKKRNIPRALILGTAGVAVIYLLVNAAYINGIGFDAARRSTAIAADVLQGALGSTGANAMAILVIISALGALNGLILTGARITAAAGADFAFFAPLARWHVRWGTPMAAILTQMIITLTLVLLVGHGMGRKVVDAMVGAAGFPAFSWEGHGGFDTLLKCTAPVFWAFFLLSGISLFVLRVKDRNLARAFKVPFFPILPALFCATCAFMLYSAIAYAGALAWIGFAPPVAGLAVFWLFGKRTATDKLSSRPSPSLR